MIRRTTHPRKNQALLSWWCLLLVWITTTATTTRTTTAFVMAPHKRLLASKHQQLTAISKATLTEATNWNIRLVLRGLTSTQGKKLDPIIYNLECQFREDIGYEPPQGTLHIVQSPKGMKNTTPTHFPIQKSRWILSEDPNDRKDGLWVWGLFQEPLYPFLLLTIQTDTLHLFNNNNNDDDDDNNKKKDSIPPMQLYAQINHRRENGNVILEGKDLCWRQMETVRADPLGAATVDLYENVVVGTIALQPKQ